MGRWVETSTWWQGDLLHLERRRFTGWCVEGKRELGGTIELVRIVNEPDHHLPPSPPDFDFLRVFALTAMLQATFLVMVAVTPKPAPRFVVEESIHDARLRRGMLASGDGDGWGRSIAPIAPVVIAGPAPQRIVIPTPIGSRVRPHSDDDALTAPYAILSVLGSTDHVVFASLDSDAVHGGFGLEGGGEGGVVGGVITGFVVEDTTIAVRESGALGVGIRGGSSALVLGGGSGDTIGVGTIGLANKNDSRCGPLVDHLVERVFADETRRGFVRRMCRRATPRAIDCLEQAMSTDDASAAKIVAKCGADLPPALTENLRNL